MSKETNMLVMKREKEKNRSKKRDKEKRERKMQSVLLVYIVSSSRGNTGTSCPENSCPGRKFEGDHE